MAFEFSDVTLLSKPIIKREKALYYAIDHLPTLDFDHASKEISSRIITILPAIIQCLDSKAHCPAIIESAIQIKRGAVLNLDIHYFKENFT